MEPSTAIEYPDSSIVGAVFTPAPGLPSIDSSFGKADILQVVGFRSDEMDRAIEGSATWLVDLLAKRDPLLLTVLQRPSLFDDPTMVSEFEARAGTEGASCGWLDLDGLEWEEDDHGNVSVYLARTHARRLGRVLAGRTPFGRPLITSVSGREPDVDTTVVFLPAEVTKMRLEEHQVNDLPPGLYVHLAKEELASVRQGLERGDEHVARSPGPNLVLIPR